jgi:hypothetical protein
MSPPPCGSRGTSRSAAGPGRVAASTQANTRVAREAFGDLVLLFKTERGGFQRLDRIFDGQLPHTLEAFNDRLWSHPAAPEHGAKVRLPYLKGATAMLAKLTSKNQLTLPKAATQAVGPAEYFEVEARNGQIVLTPVRIQRADAVRAKLAELALTDTDVADAVAWARGPATAPAAAASVEAPARPRRKRA